MFVRSCSSTLAIPCRQALEGAGITTKQQQEGPTTVKYVDMAKTSDIYDKVREFQETGKKRYP